ncbi:TPA: ClpXP protease specificity-enhancing factor [Vibrio cholerae]|uniref:ClpXP protease specificity-enhancing factor n=1 Tax=Vibrio cholerae TaxID=666 RepID=UPI0013B47119|nr:ClpXP protease specificity-enhancing factor [Vibrio cholerae]EII2377567.1 ClpXP protease specificity-enhancing factor [Vibrio cholerae]EJL6269556.1 ClpXP protease specificity-enhancing factor [Vibrio cholerae]EJL6915418.1 ClpXP protease specificity-enhancing factor [Vibrio cholerae]EKB5072356.1 ClpXP protease specificity-enhancing factor [Vibrio cholerae]EKF9748525.1 ClpXP protease specificity-enhancing factor [Vibrio cholerae]
MDIGQMTPRRPYLLRAFYDWLLENELTPHLVVDATLPGVKVPLEYVQDGQIILNVAPRAVGNLELGNDEVTFNARFGGRPHLVIVPIYAVQAIYARENGAGTMFEPEPAYLDMMDFPEEIDSDDSLIELESDVTVEHTEETPRPKGKPSLRVVK